MNAFLALLLLAAPPDTGKLYPPLADSPYGNFPQWRVDQTQWAQPVAFLILAGDKTGNRDYYRRACEQPPSWPLTYGRDQTRQESLWNAVYYMRLKEHMTDEQRTEWERRLNLWAVKMLAYTRLGDSDETVGHYIGLAATDRALGTRYLESTASDHANDLGNPAEMKAAIETFIERSKGGAWIEGTSYNLNTCMLLLNAAGLLGVDHFRGLREWLPELALYLRFSVTDNFDDGEQHGDVQGDTAHNPMLHYRIPLACQVIALGGDTDGELAKLVAAQTAGVETPYGLYPWVTGLQNAMWLLPDLPRNPGYKPARGTFIASGAGLVIHRTDRTFLQLAPRNRTFVDHDGDAGSKTGGWGDVRWQYQGQWLLDHPIGVQEPLGRFNAAIPCGVDHLLDRRFGGAAGDGTSCIAWGEMKTPYKVPGRDITLEYLPSWVRTFDYSEGDGGARLVVADTWKMQEPLPAFQRKANWETRFWIKSEPRPIEHGFTWGDVRLTCPAAEAREIERDGEWWVLRLLSNKLAERMETTIAVGIDVPQPPPVEPPGDEPRVSLPARVELRRYSDRIERVEVFPLTP